MLCGIVGFIIIIHIAMPSPNFATLTTSLTMHELNDPKLKINLKSVALNKYALVMV